MTKDFKMSDKKIIKFGLSIIFLSLVLVCLPIANVLATLPYGEVPPSEPPVESGWWDTAKKGGLDQVGKAYGGDPRDAREIVVDIIKIVLGFLGLLAVILILYAGFKWMTAGGNEENVATAKNILIAGVIGLIIILSAYILANFVINQIYGAATGVPVVS